MNIIHQYLRLIFILLSFILLSSCFHEDEPDNNLNPTVKVFKYDTSIQCGYSGIPLDVMALELINMGIDIICSQKGHDGLVYAASCGIGTGNINIYTINTVNLIDAETINFSPVSELSEYQDEACIP